MITERTLSHDLLSHELSNHLSLILGILLAATVFSSLLMLLMYTRKLKAIREELEALRQASRNLAQKEPKPAVPKPRIVPQERAPQRPNEVIRIARSRPDQAAMAQTVLIVPATPAPKIVEKVYVAKAGRNLGQFEVTTIREMLKAGELSARDHFFEMNQQIWSRLECLPGFCA